MNLQAVRELHLLEIGEIDDILSNRTRSIWNIESRRKVLIGLRSGVEDDFTCPLGPEILSEVIDVLRERFGLDGDLQFLALEDVHVPCIQKLDITESEKAQE